MAADDRQSTGALGRAVVYVRISDDPDRLERGVERQEEDCRAFADRLGVEVVEVLRENDTSAFKQRTIVLPSGEKVRRVVRPKFRHMLRLLAEGRADVMVAYDLDRAVRDPRDLEDLIDARVLYGFAVKSVTGSLRSTPTVTWRWRGCWWRWPTSPALTLHDGSLARHVSRPRKAADMAVVPRTAIGCPTPPCCGP